MSRHVVLTAPPPAIQFPIEDVSRRGLLTTTITAAVFIACGSDDSGQDSQPDGNAGVFPLSVEHKYGATTIPKRPERVVSVGLSDHEPVIALGVVPVGVED